MSIHCTMHSNEDQLLLSLIFNKTQNLIPFPNMRPCFIFNENNSFCTSTEPAPTLSHILLYIHWKGLWLYSNLVLGQCTSLCTSMMNSCHQIRFLNQLLKCSLACTYTRSFHTWLNLWYWWFCKEWFMHLAERGPCKKTQTIYTLGFTALLCRPQNQGALDSQKSLKTRKSLYSNNFFTA